MVALLSDCHHRDTMESTTNNDQLEGNSDSSPTRLHSCSDAKFMAATVPQRWESRGWNLLTDPNTRPYNSSGASQDDCSDPSDGIRFKIPTIRQNWINTDNSAGGKR